MSRRPNIVVVDDQAAARHFLEAYLCEVGYQVRAAASVPDALGLLERAPADLVITDLRMPDIDGLEAIRRFRRWDADVPIIVLTAYATVETAVAAMKLGAFHYLKKPIEPEEMEILVARALAHRELLRENRLLREEAADRSRLQNLIGQSPQMERVLALVRKVAPADVPVLVTGESGTGKDLLARAIHGLSRRASKLLLSINCAAVPDSLLASELFGHERGAFSGAVRARSGYFREADGGTLFLDEIGEMSLAHQSALLRVLESGELIPVGAEKAVTVDVRVIAATNRCLEELVAQGRFREDLLFRLDTVRVELPPLRARKEDIGLLVAHFLERAPVRPGEAAPRMSPAALRALMAYAWPGNVRELAHAVEHAVLVAEGETIEPADLPARVLEAAVRARPVTHEDSYRGARLAFERDYFSGLLERAGGNVTRAAELAGIHRTTLHTKLRQLELMRE